MGLFRKNFSRTTVSSSKVKVLFLWGIPLSKTSFAAIHIFLHLYINVYMYFCHTFIVWQFFFQVMAPKTQVRGVLSTGSIHVGLGSRFTCEDTLTYKRIKHVMSPYRIFKTFIIKSKRGLRRTVIGDSCVFKYDRIDSFIWPIFLKRPPYTCLGPTVSACRWENWSLERWTCLRLHNK